MHFYYIIFIYNFFLDKYFALIDFFCLLFHMYILFSYKPKYINVTHLSNKTFNGILRMIKRKDINCILMLPASNHVDEVEYLTSVRKIA